MHTVLGIDKVEDRVDFLGEFETKAEARTFLRSHLDQSDYDDEIVNDKVTLDMHCGTYVYVIQTDDSRILSR